VHASLRKLINPSGYVSDNLIALVVVEEKVKALRVEFSGGMSFFRKSLKKSFNVFGVRKNIFPSMKN
jgi:hypothetical protein